MRALDILHLETRDVEAQLVEEQLRAGKLEAKITRVQNKQEFEQQVGREEVDVILASDASCDCDASGVLSILRGRAPHVPFILLSQGAEISSPVESLNGVVTDFVAKPNLARLVPAIRRAVREASQNKQLVRARERLSSQAELLDLVNDSIILCDAHDTITFWNHGSQNTYGWSRSEAIGQNVHALLRTRFQEEKSKLETTLRTTDHWKGELEQVRRDGRPIF